MLLSVLGACISKIALCKRFYIVFKSYFVQGPPVLYAQLYVVTDILNYDPNPQ